MRLWEDAMKPWGCVEQSKCSRNTNYIELKYKCKLYIRSKIACYAGYALPALLTTFFIPLHPVLSPKTVLFEPQQDSIVLTSSSVWCMGSPDRPQGGRK
jgi:hypothetical protein